MQLIILISIFFLFDYYIFQSFMLAIASWPDTLQLAAMSLYWVIPVTYIASFFFKGLEEKATDKQNTFMVYRSVIGLAYLSKLLIFGILLLDDLRLFSFWTYDQLAGPFYYNGDRTVFMSQFAFLLGGIPFSILLYGLFRNPYRYKLFSETITLENLPPALDGLRIVQISDIHSGSWNEKEPVRKAIDMINRQKADLVFFTGDLVNSIAAEMEEFMDIFAGIKSTHGIYSILGNHDYGDYYRWNSREEKQANFRRLLNIHKEMGWDLMLNENRILSINGEKLGIIGVENYSATGHFHRYGDLEKATENMEETSVKLLLSHDPTHWATEVIQKYKNIDITFSGHTHGMQFGIEIPGWIKWSPVKYFYKHWAGLYQKGNQYLYVNRGLGFLGYPGRVGILPEVTLIKLKRGAKKS